MAKFGIFASITAICVALGFAAITTTSVSSADAANPCVRKDFKTVMVKEACTAGGQDKAKEVMKTWNKEKGIKSCNKCHDKLAPTYSLKPDGLKIFTDLGGK